MSSRRSTWAAPSSPEFLDAPCTPLFLIGGGHIENADATNGQPTAAVVTTCVVQTAQAIGLVDYALEWQRADLCIRPKQHPADFASGPAGHQVARTSGFSGDVLSADQHLNDRGRTTNSGTGAPVFAERPWCLSLSQWGRAASVLCARAAMKSLPA
jgi:hypothetical protein